MNSWFPGTQVTNQYQPSAEDILKANLEKTKQQKQAEKQVTKKEAAKKEIKFTSKPVLPETHNRLLTLLSGDSVTLERLVKQTRLSNLEKTEEWVYQKVIFDLTKDRY